MDYNAVARIKPCGSQGKRVPIDPGLHCVTSGLRKRLPAACLLIVASAATGCADIAPWERGNLAKPNMALDPFPVQSAMRAHTYGSREAAAGGDSAGGGGCGCY